MLTRASLPLALALVLAQRASPNTLIDLFIEITKQDPTNLEAPFMPNYTQLFPQFIIELTYLDATKVLNKIAYKSSQAYSIKNILKDMLGVSIAYLRCAYRR